MSVPRLHGLTVPNAIADWSLLAVDVCLLWAVWAAALLLRYDGQVPEDAWTRWLFFVPVAVALAVAGNAAAGLYAGVWRHAGVDEARRVLVAQTAALVVVVPLVIFLGHPVPLSLPLIALPLAIGAVGAVRFRSRLFRTEARRAKGTEQIVVLGAGDAGAALAHDVQQEAGRTTAVVAFLDDDPHLLGRRIHGVPVVGRIADLPQVAARTRLSYAVAAIPSAGPQLLRRLAPLAEQSGTVLRVVPPLAELVAGDVRLTDVRDLEVSDLLRRGEVDTDLAQVTSLVAGKRVLITGGGGSIGSEIARQVARLGAARVVLLDHDETHLFDTAPSVPGCVQRLCDIREPAAVDQVFGQERPELVFHAAAHKHVPLLEDHPVEAVETNVFGTRTVVQAARRAGVSRFVLISTDKAVDPSSIMGASKSVAEKVVLSHSPGMTACAVRFGNVLGSRGSVVPTFVQQIRAGGPVTVTDGRMTRYFMTIPEAVRLVLHAAALASRGDIFMLDMGRPVRILDLAVRMIRLSGRRPGTDVEVRVTGVRPGEKLTEQLHTSDERQHATAHPSVLRLTPALIEPRALDEHLQTLALAVARRDDDLARTTLGALVRRAPASPVPEQRALLDDPAEKGSKAWIS